MAEYHKTNEMNQSLSGKAVLITGSTDGLGKLVATHLAQQDAVVLLHGRNRAKGKALVEDLMMLTQNKSIHYYNGDFASFREVKELGNEIIKNHQHIDILINNVGIGSGVISGNNRREISKDGLELRFQVNYVSHVLLTEMLLPLLSDNTGNIINVASIGQEPIDFDNIMLEKNYDGYVAYKQSKTALIMYTFDWLNVCETMISG